MRSTRSLRGALKVLLAGQLPALVAAEGLPAVVEFLDYDPALPQPAKAPQVWVDIARTRPGQPAAFGGPGAKRTRTRQVLVGVTCAGEDPSAATGRLDDYTDLIEGLLTGHITVANQALTLRWMGTEFSPNLARNATSLFRLAILTFEVDRWTELGTD